MDGGGTGYKLGFIYIASWGLQRKVMNCLSAYNREAGFTSNDYYVSNGPDSQCQSMELYNNTAFHNGYSGDVDFDGVGFIIYKTNSTTAE